MSSSSQEISLILWNPKVHYCIDKSPPLIPFLSQINPVHAFLIPPEKYSQTNIYENRIIGVLLLPAYKVEVYSNVMFYGNKLVSMSVEWRDIHTEFSGNWSLLEVRLFDGQTYGRYFV